HFRNQLVTQKLIDEEAIFIDGTKIEANANKYTFVWKKSINNYEVSLTNKSKELYHQLVQEQIIPAIQNEDEPLHLENLTEITHSLETEVNNLTDKINNENNVEQRKALRNKRIKPRKYLKQFRDFKTRTQKYQKQKAILNKRNSYSKTDNDATFMRMKDDHMKNGQLKPGYNVQIATNNQYVLAYDVFQNQTDFKTLIPFLETIKDNYFKLPKYIVADVGYGSEENYQAIIDVFERIPLITYTMYQKELKKKHRITPFNVTNWRYDELLDVYF
ncbi:hypothetical protein CBF36_06585, partial [Vagococcus bubulae]